MDKGIYIKIDNEQLFEKVKRAVIQLIKQLTEIGKDRLPPESDLAASLGVSRTVIRDVLADLESKGFISRKRGIGTIINKHVLEADVRLDIDQEIKDILLQKGYEPKIEVINFEKLLADEKVAKLLKINPNEEILQVETVIYADGNPAVHIIDKIPLKLISAPYDIRDFEGSIFEFMKEKCSNQIESDLSQVKPAKADAHLAAIFQMEEGDLLLFLDEIGYSAGNEPILWSQEYFHPEIFDFKVFRRKL
ncbi:GntR family transcriptional regulator [Bacillus sp. BRMEA1]|uniref:GntR family transcriptional regulator n=1 Tax=Neobacillus endophyticus TaxID=2738405 RepID=UPI001563C05D|nr:GntR family transcriptional regulator [Neobacillus endophyticus]NRD79230.1 GntR family transcriptional regulator [Neobacillus endophyticus]